jgi:hypothetical protein
MNSHGNFLPALVPLWVKVAAVALLVVFWLISLPRKK